MGNMSSRGRYRSYTIKFKLEVVRYALNHSKAEASRKFGVHRKLSNLVPSGNRIGDYVVVEEVSARRWYESKVR